MKHKAMSKPMHAMCKINTRLAILSMASRHGSRQVAAMQLLFYK